jgi:hypothetical protein
MIRITCPKCQSRWKLTARAAVPSVACRKCGRRLPVPQTLPPAAEEPPAGTGVGGLLWSAVALVIVAILGGALWAVLGSSPQQPAPAAAAAPRSPGPKPLADARGRGEGAKLPAPHGPGQRYAVLIGVKQYGEETGLTNLQGTEPDVEELAAVLLQAGYPAANVVLLTQGENDRRKDPALLPTRDNIRAALDRITRKCTPADLMLVAFAGHGTQPSEGAKVFFCPAGCNVNDPKTLVSLNEVYQKLDSCKAGFKLLVADSCRNDPTSRSAPRKPTSAADGEDRAPEPPAEKPPDNVYAFYSCSKGEQAFEVRPAPTTSGRAPEPPDDKPHGLFFSYLIKGLRGEADFKNDGKITLGRLQDYLIENVASHAALRLRQRQRPYFMGGTNVVMPLVSWQVQAPQQAKRDQPRARPLDPTLLLSEDFRDVKDGDVPGGWDAPGFGVTQDADRRWLEVNRGGQQELRLPQTPLAGDFAIKGEFSLPDNAGRSNLLRLDLEAESATVRAEVFPGGEVVMAPLQASRRVEVWKRGERNHFRLEREGRIYRFFLNDVRVVGGTLEVTGEVRRLKLMLAAGARLYSIRVGSTAKAPAGGNKSAVVVEEDFRNGKVGAVPEGWKAGEGIAIYPDNGGKDLQAQGAPGVHFVTLPPMALRGDCAVECSFSLGSSAPVEKGTGPVIGEVQSPFRPESQPKNVLQVRLRDEETYWLPATIDSEGVVSMSGAQRKSPGTWNEAGRNDLRLERAGDTFRVYLNNTVVLTAPLALKGDLVEVALGLTAPDGKLYAVRVSAAENAVGKPGEGGKGVPVVAQDFHQTRTGALPEGWACRLGTVAVRSGPGGPALAFNGGPRAGDEVTLPVGRLGGEFSVTCDFEVTAPGAAVGIRTGPPVSPLIVMVTGQQQFVVDSPGNPEVGRKPIFTGRVRTWHQDRPNVLRVERRRAAAPGLNEYRVLINGEVTWVSRPHPNNDDIEDVTVGFQTRTQTDPGGRVYAVRVGAAARGDSGN